MLSKKVISAVLCCSLMGLHAQDSLNYESLKNLGQTAEETRAYEQSSLIDLERNKQNEGQFNYSEVIYEHFKAYQRTPRGVRPDARKIVANYDFHQNNYMMYQQEQERRQNQLQNARDEALKPDVRFLQAYCTLRNEVNIERISGYAMLSCDFMKHGNGTLAVTLTPDFFAQALIATPLYVELDGKRLLVQEGVVLNGVRNSINVATIVNDYKIQKIVAAGGIALGTSATRYAQRYLDKLEDSRTNEEGGEVIVTNGTVVTTNKTTNTEKPHSSDYISGALVEFVSSMVNIIGNAVLDDFPYTFQIDKDTIMFADLQVDFNQEGIRGTNYAPNNMIQLDEPRMGNDGSYDTRVGKYVPLSNKNTISTQNQITIQNRQQQNQQPYNNQNRDIGNMNMGGMGTEVTPYNPNASPIIIDR